MCRFTAISENSRQKNLKPMEYPRSILSVEDSRAKMLAQQVKELVSLIVKGTLPAPVFGESMPGLFASLSQNGSWQKTCAGYSQSLLPGFGGEDSELFCGTWPKWGIVLDGHAMELPMLEHHINESECLSWRTPNKNDGDRGPKTKDLYERCIKTGQSMITLVDQVKNWPTPRAREGNSGSYGCASIERNAEKNYLDGVVIKTEEKPGNLNADWIELLMGLPIGWTAIDVAKEDIDSWPGWPAPLNNRENWGTYTATGTVRSSDFIRNAITPIEFVKKNMKSGQYAYEPARVIVGQKNRAKRLKALGNGCVPQQVYLVFAAIVEVENEA